jgi:hypothetical protein
VRHLAHNTSDRQVLCCWHQVQGHLVVAVQEATVLLSRKTLNPAVTLLKQPPQRQQQQQQMKKKMERRAIALCGCATVMSGCSASLTT